MRPRCLSAVLCCVLISVLPAHAHANLRAPRQILSPSSSTLAKPGEGLTVLGEKLSFDCGLSSCNVEAIYTVVADRPSTQAFEFVLPTRASVDVRVAGAAASARAEPDGTWVSDEADPRIPSLVGNTPLPLYRASFAGGLVAGVNRIELRYVQPLSSVERDYGYFNSKGRFVAFFAYEAGPLKEWALDKEFTLDVSVAIPRQGADTGGWRLFPKRRSIECFVPGSKVSEDDGNRVILRARLDRNFPDRLVCQLGDEDLLTNPQGVPIPTSAPKRSFN